MHQVNEIIGTINLNGHDYEIFQPTDSGLKTFGYFAALRKKDFSKAPLLSKLDREYLFKKIEGILNSK